MAITKIQTFNKKQSRDLQMFEEMLINDAYQREVKAAQLIKEQNARARPVQLSVSAHAVERFKDRVANLPDKEIKSLLKDCSLYKAHDAGQGRPSRHEIPGYSNAFACVQNYKVRTVIKKV